MNTIHGTMYDDDRGRKAPILHWLRVPLDLDADAITALSAGGWMYFPEVECWGHRGDYGRAFPACIDHNYGGPFDYAGEVKRVHDGIGRAGPNGKQGLPGPAGCMGNKPAADEAAAPQRRGGRKGKA